jgi:cobalt/nickel transport protein
MKAIALPVSVIVLAAYCATAHAHFHMLFPDTRTPPQPGGKVTFTYRWGHPFEHEMFDAPKPAELIVINPKGDHTKVEDLRETQLEKKIARTFSLEIPKGVDALGDYVLAMTTPQVFMAEEESILQDTVKAVLHVQAQKGWDRIVGLPFELVPLTRPYGLEPGVAFQAQALYKDKPLAGVYVEVERYNVVPPKKLPPDEQRTRVVKTDPNGVLTCTLPDPGWWCITAYKDGGKAKHEDKEYPLQMRSTFWVYVEPKP